MKGERIGVALTCFNRCDKTRSCLHALYASAAEIRRSGQLTVVLTDDASSDGTADMVRAEFPEIEIVRGNGNLFWVGGMRLALDRLYARRLDYYLWLNDDTILDAGSLETLLATHRLLVSETGKSGIVIGSTRDASGKLSYGGLRRKPLRFGALAFDRVIPTDKPQVCDTHNGNVVMVSTEATEKLGNLDIAFLHGMADIDYGLRAKSAKIPVWVMPGYAGRCDRDHQVAGSFRDPSLSLSRRLELLSSSKVLPYAEWLTLCRRHTGPFWMLHFSWPYLKTIISSFRVSIFGSHSV